MLHPAEMVAAGSINNTSFSDTCTEWSQVYNNCQIKPSGAADPTVSDQMSSRSPDYRTVVTDTGTSKDSSDNMALIVGTVIGGIIFVFLLMVVVLTAIVCLRKRYFRQRSNHLIHGPAVLECKQYLTPSQHSK